MFNGIVEGVGIIRNIHEVHDCIHFTVAPQIAFQDLNIGDSISVNGVCLTITELEADTFLITAVPETLRLTNLGELEEGDYVNLERSLRMDSRIGGHYVQGHVDDVGEITEIEEDGEEVLMVTISASPHLTKYIVKKGYVALDGMSITVVDVTDDDFTVTFIPHTQQVTIVKNYEEGTRINIEVDIMGKYIEKLLKVH